MIKIANMLMIGSCDRNVGKTEFACSVIRRFGREREIIAIKVTAVDKADGTCPRGGVGCGVCSSLEGHYYITAENDESSDKDTCRMLAAGAVKVYWLRVLKAYLGEGLAALMDVVGKEAVTVCESNSLRKVVEPGVFIMVRSSDANKCKASAREVVRYADRIVSFDGKGLDIEFGEIELNQSRWSCKLKATAIVMAGGKSGRISQDKSMLSVEERPMIEHIAEGLRPYFNQIIISANDTKKYGFLNIEVVSDEKPGHGPLGGICSAVKASGNDVNFVIACDIPEFDISVIKDMVREASEYDAVIAVSGSRYEPLFAVYKKDIYPALESGLESGNNKIIDALAGCNVKYFELPAGQQLGNINTMADYQQFLQSREKKVK